MTALARVFGLLLLYVAAIAGSNFGGQWAIPFIVVTVLIFVGGPVLDELRDPVDRKRRWAFMCASTVCWIVFTLTLYYGHPYLFEKKATPEGVVFALLTIVFGPAAPVLWKLRKRDSRSSVVQQ